MGKRKSRPKKKKTKVQQAAAKRHATFKKTGVQTQGGTKKKYSKAEARKIEKAMGPGSFSKVTGGAANPLNRAPDNQGVEAGDLVQPVKDFTEALGIDYSQFAAPQVNYNFSERPKSDISFSDAVRAGARFNEAGRNEVGGNNDVASLGGYGLFKVIQRKPHFDSEGRLINPTTESFMDNEYMNDADFQKKYKINKEQYRNLQSMGVGDGTLTATHDNRLFKSVPATGPAGDQPASDFYKKGILQKNILPGTLRNPLGIPLASTAPISTLGIQTAASGSEVGFDRDSFNRALEGNYDPDSAGGLNIGGGEGSGSRSRVLTSEQLGDAYKSTLNPDSFKGLSDGETFGSGPVASGEDYARGLNVSPYGSVENTMRSVVGKIPLVNRIPGVNTRLLTDKEIADKRISAQNQLAYRKEMAKFRGGASGGNRLPVTPTVIEEILPEALPTPSASTTPTTQTGVDPNRLLQIQQQAYAQAYNPMLIGGFNPQFRFGAATPTIDYSTYFNY